MEINIPIIVAEDEPFIAKKIQDLILELNWKPILVSDVPSLLETLAQTKVGFEILVLDRMLGSHDSADYVTTIRLNYPKLRIIILSAIDSSSEKAKLLDNGADDYLAKPFESSEFNARLKALMRRTAVPLERLHYEVANMSLDLIQRNVSVDGLVLALTVKEFL
ncbi:MAG: response regulator transcription factor, partial [Bdellovibrionales bacterium]|nr:response regulator transcription factor [Bdellovibrionales bacterium]